MKKPKNQSESAQLKRALMSLRVIGTWARCDSETYRMQQSRKQAMRDIANEAARGLGRDDLIQR